MQKAVSPKHYKDLVPGYQYMNMMEHMLADFNGAEAHLMGQVYKYLMRYGKKDAKQQELGKVLWYLTYLMSQQGIEWNEVYDTVEDAYISQRGEIE